VSALDERLLVAVSGPSKHLVFTSPNVRLREKQTFRLGLEKSGGRASALPPEAAVKLIG